MLRFRFQLQPDERYSPTNFCISVITFYDLNVPLSDELKFYITFRLTCTVYQVPRMILLESFSPIIPNNRFKRNKFDVLDLQLILLL